MISTLDEPAKILTALRAIRGEIAEGVYDPVQVVGASNAFEVLLKSLNSKPRRRVTRSALYKSLGVSRSIATNVVTLRSTPKMENFFPIVDGLIEEYESELGLRAISLDALHGVPANYVSISKSSAKHLSILVELLAELVEKVRSSNSSVGGVLGELERQQLIVVLETALGQLKSPAVEVNFLQKLRGWLQALAAKSVKKGGETLVGGLANSAATELAKFIKGLF